MSLRKTKINRSNRISSPEEEEEEKEEKEKERGKKNAKERKRDDKDPPYHVDVCVCVLFLLLCPRLNVRLQVCVDEMCCFRQSFIQKVVPSRKKLILTKTSKKKTSKQQPLQIYSHKSTSVDTHGYTTLI